MYMTRGNSGMLGLILTFILAGMVGLVGLALLGSVGEIAVVQQVAVADSAIEWSAVRVPTDLMIAEHAQKHGGQTLNAWTLYTYLLEGQCVATAVYCRNGDLDRLYLCTVPEGRIGGIFTLGEEILTGFEGKGNYWKNVIQKGAWEVCQ